MYANTCSALPKTPACYEAQEVSRRVDVTGVGKSNWISLPFTSRVSNSRWRPLSAFWAHVLFCFASVLWALYEGWCFITGTASICARRISTKFAPLCVPFACLYFQAMLFYNVRLKIRRKMSPLCSCNASHPARGKKWLSTMRAQ